MLRKFDSFSNDSGGADILLILDRDTAGFEYRCLQRSEGDVFKINVLS